MKIPTVNPVRATNLHLTEEDKDPTATPAQAVETLSLASPIPVEDPSIDPSITEDPTIESSVSADAPVKTVRTPPKSLLTHIATPEDLEAIEARRLEEEKVEEKDTEAEDKRKREEAERVLSSSFFEKRFNRSQNRPKVNLNPEGPEYIANLNKIRTDDKASPDTLALVLDAYDKRSLIIKGREEYSSLENAITRSFLGLVEVPRYLAAVPGLLIDVAEQKELGAVSTVVDAIFGWDMMRPMTEAYDKYIVQPVIKGTTLDQEFETAVTKTIEAEYPGALTDDFLEKQAVKEVAVESALTMGVLGIRKALTEAFKHSVLKGGAFKQLDEVTQEAIKKNVLSPSTATMSKKDVRKIQAKYAATLGTTESIKGGILGASSVWGTAQVLELIDPASKEAAILLGMGTGAIIPSITSKGLDVAADSALYKYSPTFLAIRGTKVLTSAALNTYRVGKRLNAVKRLEEQGYTKAQALHRYYSEMDLKNPERKEMALALMNDLSLDQDLRVEMAQELINQALADPFGREAEVVRQSLKLVRADEEGLVEAWSQAQLLESAFRNSDFKTQALDVYDGKFTDDFLTMQATLSPDVLIRRHKDLIAVIREKEKNAKLSPEDREKLQATAVLLEKSLQDEIQRYTQDLQKDIVIRLNDLTEADFLELDNTKELDNIRNQLDTIKDKAKIILKSGYESIDASDTIRIAGAFKDINDFLSTQKGTSEAHRTVSNLVGGLLTETLSRTRSEGLSTEVLSGSQKSPFRYFSKKAFSTARDMVYLTPKQFSELTGITLDKLNSVDSKSPIDSIPSLDLTKGKDGTYNVRNFKSPENISSLGSDGLIPVQITPRTLKALQEEVIRVRNKSEGISVMDYKRQLGTNTNLNKRHEIALLDSIVEQSRLIGTTAEETNYSQFLPKLDITKIKLSYHELDQFQRSVRKKRAAAWQANDMEVYESLTDLNEMLTTALQEGLRAGDKGAFETRQFLDGLYGGSFMNKIEDPKASFVGSGTSRSKNGVPSTLMSELLDKVGNTIEFREQLINLMEPRNSEFFAAYQAGIGEGSRLLDPSKPLNAQLDVLERMTPKTRKRLERLVGLDESLLKSMESQSINISSSILLLKAGNLMETLSNAIGTVGDNPMALYRDEFNRLMSDPVVTKLMEASEGTETHGILSSLMNSKTNEEFLSSLLPLQTVLSRFDQQFFKSISELQNPDNTSKVLDIVENMHKLPEAEARLLINPETSHILPIMFNKVLDDIIVVDSDGIISRSHLESGLARFREGLEVMPGGQDVIVSINHLLDYSKIQKRLHTKSGKSSPEEIWAEANVFQKLGSYIPGLFSDIRSAKKGIISMDYAVVSGVMRVSRNVVQDMKGMEGKAVHELFVASMQDKRVFDALRNYNMRTQEMSSLQRLKGSSAIVYGLLGLKLNTLNYYVETIEEAEREGYTEEARRKAAEAMHSYMRALEEGEEPEVEPEVPEVEPTKPLEPKEEKDDMKRQDGTDKSTGFFGPQETSDGRIMTEYSVGIEIDGKEVEIPTLVPTLTKEELDHLKQGGEPTDSIMDKAIEHAKERMSKGLSPFWTEGEEVTPVPTAEKQGVAPVEPGVTPQVAAANSGPVPTIPPSDPTSAIATRKPMKEIRA